MKIILLDGPSASGKSRLKSEVLNACPGLVFCPRITTRPRRDKESDADYDFVTPEEFKVLEREGRLAAFRHFQFGMSYGLPREPVERAANSGKTAFCLIDLGTIGQARACWPHCKGILLYSPLDQLRGRLQARNSHTPEQIEERLENAGKVWAARADYDQVLMNEDGRWEQTLSRMLEFCSE